MRSAGLCVRYWAGAPLLATAALFTHSSRSRARRVTRAKDARSEQTQPNTRRTVFNRNLGFVVFATVFCIPFVLAGAHIARQGWKTARAAHASTHWPRAPASLEHCAITEAQNSDGGTKHAVEVRYAYELRDGRYTGTNLAFGVLDFGGKAGAEAFCAKLEQEPRLYAAVNPRDPQDAVLLPGGSLGDYTAVVFGVTFAGFALMFVTITMLMGAVPTAAERLEQARIMCTREAHR